MKIFEKLWSLLDFPSSETEEAQKTEPADGNMKDVTWSDNENPEIGKINALVIADGHGNITMDYLADIVDKYPDVVFLLGDNFHEDIEEIKKFLLEYGFKIPIFGVEGNHDMEGTLCSHEIENLHGKVLEWNGFLIGGISGSIRYKEEPGYCMMTSGESIALADKIPPCHILLTHDKPCFGFPERITAHSGLSGIGAYIDRVHPPVVLHGHLHEPYVKQYQSTIIRCCYKAEIISITI